MNLCSDYAVRGMHLVIGALTLYHIGFKYGTCIIHIIALLQSSLQNLLKMILNFPWS